jgi:hypothetical protein
LKPNVPLKNQGGIITPANRAASDAAFAANNPNEAMTSGMSPNLERLWQQSAGFQTEPEGDVGAKVQSQMPAIPRSGETPKTTPSITEGHTAVDSSAMESYKYDPEAQEFHAKYAGGGNTVHVFGNVSPEEATAFEQAESKGKALAQIKKLHSPPVAKIINGKRIDVIPTGARSASPEESLTQ